MIKEELMINNYGEWNKFASMGKGIFQIQISDLNYAKFIDPVILTEEWLLDFGFKRIEKDFYLDHFFIHSRKRGFTVRANYPIIEYVHQLQTIFFAQKGYHLEKINKIDN